MKLIKRVQVFEFDRKEVKFIDIYGYESKVQVRLLWEEVIPGLVFQAWLEYEGETENLKTEWLKIGGSYREYDFSVYNDDIEPWTEEKMYNDMQVTFDNMTEINFKGVAA